MGGTERAPILTKQGGRVGTFFFLGRWVMWVGRCFCFFMGEETSIEDSSCYCQNSSIIGPRLAPTFSRARCLGDNPSGIPLQLGHHHGSCPFTKKCTLPELETWVLWQKIGPGHFDVVGHSIEDLSYYCKILVLLDHIWCQHFRELVVLHTTTQEFLFS